MSRGGTQTNGLKDKKIDDNIQGRDTSKTDYTYQEKEEEISQALKTA